MSIETLVRTAVTASIEDMSIEERYSLVTASYWEFSHAPALAAA